MLVELGLGGRKSSGEIVVIEGRVDDFVAVVLQVRRFDAAWDRMPAVSGKESSCHLPFHSLAAPHLEARSDFFIKIRNDPRLNILHSFIPEPSSARPANADETSATGCTCQSDEGQSSSRWSADHNSSKRR